MARVPFSPVPGRVWTSGAVGDGTSMSARSVPTRRSHLERRGAALLGGRRQPELLDPIAHLIAVDAEQASRVRLVPIGAIQRLQKEIPFDLLEIETLGRQLERGGGRAARQRREVLGG